MVFRIYNGAAEKSVKTSRRVAGSGWVRTRAQGYQSPQLKPCSRLSAKSGYKDVTWDNESLLTLQQGELSLGLYYAQNALFCSFPFFLSFSVVLRAVLIAAGSSIPSQLVGSNCAWGRGWASRWWLAVVVVGCGEHSHGSASTRDPDAFAASNPTWHQLTHWDEAGRRAHFLI